MIHLTEAERARLIPAEWEGNVAEETGGQYLAEIKMYARDQQGTSDEVFPKYLRRWRWMSNP